MVPEYQVRHRRHHRLFYFLAKVAYLFASEILINIIFVFFRFHYIIECASFFCHHFQVERILCRSKGAIGCLEHEALFILQKRMSPSMRKEARSLFGLLFFAVCALTREKGFIRMTRQSVARQSHLWIEKFSCF